MPTLPWHETIESADDNIINIIVGSTGIANSQKLTMSVSMICEKNVLGWEIILVSGLVKCVPVFLLRPLLPQLANRVHVWQKRDCLTKMDCLIKYQKRL